MKPLEWREETSRRWFAIGRHRYTLIRTKNGRKQEWSVFVNGCELIGIVGDFSTAKKVAQDHREKS